MFARRRFLTGAVASSVAIPTLNTFAHTGTPAATSLAPVSADVVTDWLDAQSRLNELGDAAVTAFWQGDTDTLIEMGTPELAAAFASGVDLDEIISGYTHDQIWFAFPEVDGWFFGRFNQEKITGIFYQGSATPWQVVPDDTQSGDVPIGSWIGAIDPEGLKLRIQLDFSGDGDDLAVTLSIPEQLVMKVPMSAVSFRPDIPIGNRLDERIIPMGGSVTGLNEYAEQYAWSEHTLVLQTWWTGTGELSGLTLLPQPSIQVETPAVRIPARLPFDGAWLVVWGGETSFQNYHAAVAQQRYASDILLWQNGSTASAPGETVDDFYAFGQPYLAPVSGTVVTVMDGQEDITPLGPANQNSHPAGNHIVIEIAEGFVFIAHCRNGSILVQEGNEVSAGDVIAQVGNSGNTSEPHVHVHAQTAIDLFDPYAVGIPMVFENVLVNGEPVDSAMPLHGTIMEQNSQKKVRR